MNKFILDDIELDLVPNMELYLEDWQLERGIDYALILSMIREQDKQGINQTKLVETINYLLEKYLPNLDEITKDREEIRVAIIQLKDKLLRELNLI